MERERMSEERGLRQASAKPGLREGAPIERPAVPRGVGRRQALAALAGAMAPTLALAQTATPTSTPIPTPAPTPPISLFAPRQTPPMSPTNTLGPIDKTKAYFVFFQQSIDGQSVKTLRDDLVLLVEGGVKDITVVISSNGGLVTPALQLYSLIRSFPVKIKTHGQVFVGSAANLLFLAGDERSADANAKFVFHPTQAPVLGAFNTPQFDDQMRLMNDSNEILEQIYHDRTKLPDADIKRFQHEMVIYDAPKALELGIVQRVGDIGIPGDGKAKLVFAE